MSGEREAGYVHDTGDLLHVQFGRGAAGAVPSIQNEDGSLGWKLRWNPPCEANNFAAASVLENFTYLIDHCTKEEAWRRIKLLRKARQNHAR